MPELSRAAGSSSSNISIELAAQHGRRATVTRNAPSWRHIRSVAAHVLADLQLARNVSQLHRLGERALYEMLVELGADHQIRAEIETKVARFAAIDPIILRALGGDCFPEQPLRIVARRP